MPKQKNIIQFSLPEDLLNKLESLKKEGESLNLTAKRLLLPLLEDDPSFTQENSYHDLCDRISQIEFFLSRLAQPPAQWTIDSLCEKIEEIETNLRSQRAFNQLVEECLEVNKFDWERQRKINEAIKDQFNFVAMLDDNEDKKDEQLSPKTSLLNEVGLNLDLDLDDDTGTDYEYDVRHYVWETIEANKNGAKHTKKDTIEHIRHFPHPLGKRWNLSGFNQALAYWGLHWY